MAHAVATARAMTVEDTASAATRRRIICERLAARDDRRPAAGPCMRGTLHARPDRGKMAEVFQRHGMTVADFPAK